MSRSAAAVVKVSGSIPAEDEAWVRERAERTGRPFSAVVKEAIEEARRAEAQRELLDWLFRDQPPATRAELDAVEGESRAGKAPARKRGETGA